MASPAPRRDGASALQIDLITTIAGELRIAIPVLDAYIRRAFNAPGGAEKLTKREASTLITTMKTWKTAPDELKIAMGQQKLL